MGFFDFVKDAGRRLGIGDSAPTTDDLRAEVTKTGLDVKDYTVDIKDDTVVVSGTAPSQEVREKLVLALGNVHGVAKVDDQLTVVGAGTAGGASQQQSRFYTVAKGDTLSKISKEFYGDPNRYNAIFEANRPMLEHPDRIYPGQVLRIP